MISQCPHCNKDLNLNEAQLEKINVALAALQSGKSLKLGCPQCRKPIELSADGSAMSAGASAAGKQESAPPVSKPGKSALAPPKPPEVDWLASGEFEEKEVIDDINMVLVLMPEGTVRNTVVEAFKEAGYRPVFVESAEQAIEKMRFVSYAAVVFHSDFEGGKLADSLFHEHMRNMSMHHRRYIYYVLVGPEFHTLYNLEALAYSANLVINEKDADHMSITLRKGLSDYENLFGPFIGAMKEYGKK